MLKWFKQLDQVLRGQVTRPPALREGTLDISARGLGAVLLVLGLLYGLCMGLFSVINSQGHLWKQLVATTVKVPMLFFLTLIVTFPSLYVFNALVGSRLTLHSVLRLLVAALAVMLAVLASFGTIIAFFSVSTTSYPFMVILNVIVFAVSGFLGLGFLFQTLNRLTISQEPPMPVIPAEPEASGPSGEPFPPPPLPSALDRVSHQPPAPHVRSVFRIWVVVFGLVGAQMGWVLRPFVGRPDIPFQWFRSRGSNFFQAVFDTLRNLLGMSW